MTRIWLTLLFTGLLCLPFGISGNSQVFNNGITGEGPVVDRKVDLGAINGVCMTNNADVILTQGSNREVRLSGQENILENLELTKEGSVLMIKNKVNVKKCEPIKIYITLPAIETIKISGSGDIMTTNHFSGLNELNIRISGSGDVKADFDAKKVIATVSGSGDLSFMGEADYLEFKISGSGDLKAGDFKVRDAEIVISGSGDAAINVSGTIKGNVSGSGDITYSGDPKIDFHHTGSGGIHKMH